MGHRPGHRLLWPETCSQQPRMCLSRGNPLTLDPPPRLTFLATHFLEQPCCFHLATKFDVFSARVKVLAAKCLFICFSAALAVVFSDGTPTAAAVHLFSVHRCVTVSLSAVVVNCLASITENLWPMLMSRNRTNQPQSQTSKESDQPTIRPSVHPSIRPTEL